jgi:hypothetical protein
MYDIDPSWADAHSTKSANADIRALIDFVVRERHSDLSRNCIADGRSIGAFVNRIRTFHADGTIHPDLITKLQGVAGWSWTASDAHWNRGVGHLVAWCRVNAGVKLESCTVHGDFEIGRWWGRAAAQWNAQQLPPERSAELTAAWQAWSV